MTEYQKTYIELKKQFVATNEGPDLSLIHILDEYIWSLIEEHIVKPHKLMRSEKHRYLLKISFHRFDPVRHQYYPLSPYNGQLREGVKPDSANGWYPLEDFADSEERATWFSPDKIWTNCGNKVLDVNKMCIRDR